MREFPNDDMDLGEGLTPLAMESFDRSMVEARQRLPSTEDGPRRRRESQSVPAEDVSRQSTNAPPEHPHVQDQGDTGLRRASEDLSELGEDPAEG